MSEGERALDREPSTAARDGRQPRLSGALLLTLSALSAFGPISLDLYLPAFPAIATTLGVSTGDVQVTFSACLIGLGVGQLIYGPLSDRYGRRPPLLAGLVLFVVASVLCAVATSLPMLTAMRLLQGLGGCAGLVIARAIVRDLYGGSALARSFSVITSVSMLAPLVAPALGAGILRFANWHVLFGFIALFGLACLVASWRLPESLPVERRHRHGVGEAMRGYGRLLRQRRFLVPAFVAAFASGTLMSYLSSSSVVFMGEYGLSTTVFPVVFALMAGCFLLGVRLNITLLRHYRLHVLLQAYLLVAVAALVALVLLVLLGAPLWTLFIAIGAVKVCLGGTLPNATAETMEPFAHNAGAASALLGTVQMGFAGLLAAVLAALAFTPSLEMGVAMLATAAVAAVLAQLRRA